MDSYLDQNATWFTMGQGATDTGVILHSSEFNCNTAM